VALVALAPGLEHIYNGEVRDNDGRLIVVGPSGVAIGGGGGGGADPLSDGTPGGALPTKTLWIAGADGAVLRGLQADSSGRLRTVVEGTPAVSVSNFPASQAVTGPLTDAQLRAAAVPVSGPLTDTQLRASAVPVSAAQSGTWSNRVTDGTNTAAVLAAAPGSDTGQSALAVRVISQLGAGSGGGGGGTSQADKSAYVEGTTVFTPVGGVLNETITADPTEDQAAAARITPKRAVHTNIRNNAGTEIATATNPIRTDPTGTTTQPVSGTVTANGPLTDTQLRASAVPVSGPLTDTQLRASAVPVSISSAPTINVNSDNIETLADNGAFVDGTSQLFPAGYIFDEVAGTALVENDVAAARVDSKRALVNVIEDATTRGRRTIVTAEGALLNAGDTANDAVDAGNPVKTGAKATFPGIPTLVANADRTNNWSDLAGAQYIRKRPVVMYTAVYRLANATAAARPLSTGALTANTNKQIATIFHTAAATKRVQIKYVSVTLYAVTVAAGTIEFEIVTLSSTTAPATGAPAITPSKVDQGDAAAEAVCLALPGTQGSVVNADQPLGDLFVGSYGITGAGATTTPPVAPGKFSLWDSRDSGDGKDLIMRSATAEGYAVVVRANVAATVLATATIQFTEE
jgi:hypothetical protein